jgi:hypothetical protein
MDDVEIFGKHRHISDLVALSSLLPAFDIIKDYDVYCTKCNIDEKHRIHGLKMVIRTLCDYHLKILDSSHIFGLAVSEDYLHSLGKTNRQDRPELAQLDKLAKCVYLHLREFWSCGSPREFDIEFRESTQPYLKMLNNLILTNVTLQLDEKQLPNKDMFIKIASLRFFIDALLNPVNESVISQYFGPSSKEGRRRYLERIWEGYKAAIAFLLHQAYSNELEPKYVKIILEAENLKTLHAIGSELYDIVDVLLKAKFGSNDSRLVANPLLNLTHLNEFMTSFCQEPDSLSFKDLDAVFGHRRVRMFDGRSKFFAGPAAFVRLLIGEVEWKKKHPDQYDQKVIVARISHPVPGKDGFRFSYGVRIFSKDEGWLVFTECAANHYVGGMMKTYHEIEAEIGRVSDFLEVREITVSIDDLEKYVLQQMTSPKGPIPDLTDDEGLRVIFPEARMMAERTSGLLLELITSIVFANWQYGVNWAVRGQSLDDREIDVAGVTNGEFFVVECSNRMKGDMEFAEALVEEFDFKTNGLSQIERFKNRSPTRIYVTREDLIHDDRMQDVIDFLDAHNIEVTSIENLLYKTDIDEKDKIRLLDVLKELDCWRPSGTALESGSGIRDVMICLKTKHWPTFEFSPLRSIESLDVVEFDESDFREE